MIRKKYNIGLIGTGFVARGLMYTLKHHSRLRLVSVLTRRNISGLDDLPTDKKLITNNIKKLIKHCDLIVECTGDAIYGTEIVEKVLKAGLPVVTMNPELQITTGSILCQKGKLIEAEGDQPGSLAAFNLDVKSMGFKPIVYGNIKRFLNITPTKDEMVYWAKRQGITLEQVTAFTDGSKVQIEQVLVANGLGATIANRGMLGISCKDLEDGAQQLGEVADRIGKPVSDYILSPSSPAGIFIVAKHDTPQKSYLEYLKLGPGPNYVLVRPYHLVHLEIPKTILKVLAGDTDYNFNNGISPIVQVMAVAKKKIEKGKFIGRGLGSFEIRGEAVKIEDYQDCVPITLLYKAKFIKEVNEGQIVKFNDVELPKTRALEIWKQILFEVVEKDSIEEQLPRRKPNGHDSLQLPVYNFSRIRQHIGQVRLLLNQRFPNGIKKL